MLGYADECTAYLASISSSHFVVAYCGRDVLGWLTVKRRFAVARLKDPDRLHWIVTSATWSCNLWYIVSFN